MATEYENDETKTKMDLGELQALDNIVLSAQKLDNIGSLVKTGYTLDKASRQDWEARNAEAMKLALQVKEKKTFPWTNASNIKFPLITISAIGFSARAYPALISSNEPVKCRVNGYDEGGEKTKRADRIAKHMSYQILEEDESWEEEQDKLLISVPIVGTAFKKSYFDSVANTNRSVLVLASDLVVGYFTKSLETTRRATHVIPLYMNEIKEREMAGLFNEIEYQSPSSFQDDHTVARDEAQGVERGEDDDAPQIFLEQHRYLDLDGDRYEEPYIVTVHLDTGKTVRIVNRFKEVDRDADGKLLRITAKNYFTKYGFIPSPDGGFYDLGFGSLLGPINESTNTIINQLVDAGTMSNLGGGFLGRGIRIKSGKTRFEPGEWKRADNYGDDLRKGVFPLPVPQPSNVLFQLLGMLVDYGERLGSSTDMMVGVNPGQNQTATTTQNVVEQGMKVFNGIFKRLHRSMKEEFRKLYVLNKENLDQASYFETLDSNAPEQILREDYYGDEKDITPASDPNIASDQQKLAKAEAIRNAAATFPGYDRMKVEVRYLEAMDIEGIEQILPQGENAIQPPPNPEAEIEGAKLEIEKQSLQLESMKHDLAQALAQKDEEQDDKKLEIDQFKADTDRMKVQGDIALKSGDLEIKDFSARVSALEAKHRNDSNND